MCAVSMHVGAQIHGYMHRICSMYACVSYVGLRAYMHVTYACTHACIDACICIYMPSICTYIYIYAGVVCTAASMYVHVVEYIMY